MGLFNNKVKKNKKSIMGIIRKINNLETLATEENLFDVVSSLNSIVDILDSPNVILDEFQKSRIETDIAYMHKYCKKCYGVLLKNKCDSIIAILKRGEVVVDNLAISRQNEEKIYMLLGEQSELTTQIEKLTAKMNSVLGKDKGMWKLLNMQRNTLSNKLSIIAKSYSTILSAEGSVQFAKDIEKAKIEAETVLSSLELVDAGEFEDNVNFVTDVNNEVSALNSQMNEVFAKNFGMNEDDSVYERALEQKMLKEDRVDSSGVASVSSN